jgi:hypothetical protein
MASEVKAQTVSGEDFFFRLIVTIGTPDLCLLTTPRAFGSWLQRRGGTKQLIKVQAVGPLVQPDGCRGFGPAPSKLTRSPRRPFQTSSARSVERAR